MRKFVLMLIIALAPLASASMVDLAIMDVSGTGPFFDFGGYITGDVAAGDFAVNDVFPLAVLVGASDLGAVKLNIAASGDIAIRDGGFEELMGIYAQAVANVGSKLDLTALVSVTEPTPAKLEGANTLDILADSYIMYGFSVEITGTGGGSLSFDSSTQIWDTTLTTNYGAAGAQGITFIPEPMTMVLLGLGGLFLRRRR